MSAIVELIDVEEWTNFVIENVCTLFTDCKDGKPFIDSHQAYMWTQNSIWMCVSIMPKKEFNEI